MKPRRGAREEAVTVTVTEGMPFVGATSGGYFFCRFFFLGE
jgi:hypothetical protein